MPELIELSSALILLPERLNAGSKCDGLAEFLIQTLDGYPQSLSKDAVWPGFFSFVTEAAVRIGKPARHSDHGGAEMNQESAR
ncbi:MAG: hypothetical protein ACYDCC_07955 [Actinomycetota bacterium]